MSVKPWFDPPLPVRGAQLRSSSEREAVVTLSRPPARLARLSPNACRFCVQDAPEGQMHAALFCAAPCETGPYCERHRRLCAHPAETDIDELAAEIEAACAQF
jgi:hypothetical protein